MEVIGSVFESLVGPEPLDRLLAVKGPGGRDGYELQQVGGTPPAPAPGRKEISVELDLESAEKVHAQRRGHGSHAGTYQENPGAGESQISMVGGAPETSGPRPDGR
jgi:hypothetical protein